MKYTKRIMYGILIAVCVSGLSGCMNGKYRYEETMNSEILDLEEFQTAVNYYNTLNYKEAIRFYELALDRIEENIQPGTSMEYWIKGQLGECHLEIGELDTAFFYLQEAMEGLEKKDDSDMLGAIYQSIGEYYEISEQYDTALMYYDKALEYAGDDEIVSVYRLMADTYSDMDRKEKALEYYDLAIEMGEKLNDLGSLVNVYYRKGIMWALDGELEGAKKCFEKGKEYAEYYWKEDHIKVAEAYTYLAKVSAMEEDYETAYSYSKKALDIYTNQNSKYACEYDIATIYGNMGYMNMELGNYDAALKMVRKAYDIAVDRMEEDTEMRDLFNDFILDNIKSIYDEFVHDGTSYDTWFSENFEN